MTRLLSHIAHADHPCALLFVRRWRPRRKEWCRLTIGLHLGSERYMDRERAVAHFNESALKRSIEFFLDGVVDFPSFAKGKHRDCASEHGVLDRLVFSLNVCRTDVCPVKGQHELREEV